MTPRGQSTVHIDVCSGVARLEFSAPDRNAWDAELDAAYARAMEGLDNDPDVRVILMKGAGGHFCPGRAVSGLRSAARSGGARQQSHGIDRTRDLRKPVVAVVHGSCAGVGLTLALMCDVRFASNSAAFSTAFVRRGLPAGHGTSWLLGRTVGNAQATELLLSGRKLDGAEAARIGLVHRSVPDDQLDAVAEEYAHNLAENCSPRSMSIVKRQLRRDCERGYAEALAESLTLADDAFGSPDFAEGVDSYQERRPPLFPPLDAVEGSS